MHERYLHLLCNAVQMRGSDGDGSRVMAVCDASKHPRAGETLTTLRIQDACICALLAASKNSKDESNECVEDDQCWLLSCSLFFTHGILPLTVRPPEPTCFRMGYYP